MAPFFTFFTYDKSKVFTFLRKIQTITNYLYITL